MERHRPTEYLVLRQTIAQRGTLRPVLVLIGTAIWAVLLIAVLAFLPYPVAAAIPLLALLVTFEVIRPLHFGAERIGRYLQVFHERAHAGWEHVTMEYGRRYPAGGSDPLFGRVFILATSVNFPPGGTRRRTVGSRHRRGLSLRLHLPRAQGAESCRIDRAEYLRRFQALIASDPGA